MPRREWGAVGERLQFAQPDFSLQDQRRVGTAEIFFLRILWALTDLHGVILNPHDVGFVVAFQVLNADLASEHGCADLIG